MQELHLENYFEQINTSFSELEDYRIPVQYHLTRAILQVRDPLFLHLYWEFNHQDTRSIENEIGDSKILKIRLHDVTGKFFNGHNSDSYREYDGSIGPYGRYLEGVSPNRTYVAQVGFYDSNDNFKVVVTSNLVTTPRNEVSEVIDEEWMTIDELFRLRNLRSSSSSHSLVKTDSTSRSLNNGSGSSTNF